MNEDKVKGMAPALKNVTISPSQEIQMTLLKE